MCFHLLLFFLKNGAYKTFSLPKKSQCLTCISRNLEPSDDHKILIIDWIAVFRILVSPSYLCQH